MLPFCPPNAAHLLRGSMFPSTLQTLVKILFTLVLLSSTAYGQETPYLQEFSTDKGVAVKLDGCHGSTGKMRLGHGLGH